jgi:hypothetical protein
MAGDNEEFDQIVICRAIYEGNRGYMVTYPNGAKSILLLAFDGVSRSTAGPGAQQRPRHHGRRRAGARERMVILAIIAIVLAVITAATLVRPFVVPVGNVDPRAHVAPGRFGRDRRSDGLEGHEVNG